jgi:uncharacterized repeat protein (TIGR01451 family)
MKKQINPTIKAHLIRSVFILLSLLAVCAIPFALAQRNSSEQSKQFQKALGSSQPLTTPEGQIPEGIDVPDGTRKCIKPQERAPKPTDLLFTPLACLEPVVNVSATLGNQAESFVNVNPTNTNNLVATSNNPGTASIFRAYSTDAGATWTRGTIATGVACCDGQAAWDTFGNLFLVYINNGLNQINVILSTDGGVTFSAPLTVGTGSIDQPSIAVGNGSVWVDWNQSGSMVARGAPVTGLGVFGPFNAQQAIPSATGSFGGIAVGPGPNGGKVIVTYQSPTGGQGPATIFANVDADGLGAGGFGARVTVSATNVGGFDFIPAQSERSIDAEAGVVWDATGGPFNNRIYLVYTDETVNENNDTDILMRTSIDDGATWSAPVRVNDDATTNSQFLPYVALDSTTGTVGVGFHDCRNDNGVPGPGGTNMIPNDDAEYFGTFSTDGGATWAPNQRLSGGFSNATASGNGIDYGDYVGLSALAGKLYTMWADNANCDGTNPNGTLSAFDLYTNTIPTIIADLSVTKTDSPDPVTTGDDLTYTVTVTNNGPDTATSVTVTDNLPAETTFVSCSSTGGGVCGGSGNNQIVTFASLASGQSETITFVANVNCSVADGTVISNTATVSSLTFDPDTTNNSSTTTTTASNPPPTITGATANPSVLWPPNHRMVNVTVSYDVTDNCPLPPGSCTLSVASNEPVLGHGSGHTSPDWIVLDDHHVLLRAEREGNGNGRIYTITITCTDSGGNSSTEEVEVTVPHDRGRH